ncbi:MAG: pyrimidine 5'-nucleotidase [Rhodocyclaceae bacterium]|nr:pyrimidine 5'-nucleotidase [Rhodocyclaceae bacterium]
MSPGPRSKPSPVWLFDLDNTLHDASHAIFPQINRAMTDYIARHLALERAEAHALRERYWRHYGATMTGLVKHHAVAPRHFLHETHHLEDLERMLVYDRRIGRLLRSLPGRRVVFSNGPRDYALQVLAAMRLLEVFERVFAIEDMGYQPKPGSMAFRRLLGQLRLHPRQCILVEDSEANLRPAKRLGMRTVWISPALRQPPHVDLRLASIAELSRRSRAALGPLAGSGISRP